MFQTDMWEKKENVVEVDDMKPEFMEDVLNFIYTDNIDFDLVQITDLLAAADKYQIEGLRIVCLEAIVSGLSIENVVEVIAITDRYEIPALRNYTINFLALKRAKVIAEKNWDEVMKSAATNAYANGNSAHAASVKFKFNTPALL
ncbi:hypothetical protein TSAR_003058 [Trichomalopsis sarcophagae]|uniref:BTB domain-containing protein n=1 Tax=Trichomalopsis sarcophagae TaxID=543379 RepID=A0A232FIH0_9HYME|nr:hypothetical protein TSAR_003058 [Trichomalopsis sarcophagae]